MTRKEKNEEIAKILGFKKHPIKKGSGVHYPQWSYPEEWQDEIRVSPNGDIPDFIQMIDDTRSIAKKFQYGFKRVHASLEF